MSGIQQEGFIAGTDIDKLLCFSLLVKCVHLCTHTLRNWAEKKTFLFVCKLCVQAMCALKITVNKQKKKH